MYNVAREAYKFRVENNITSLPIDYEYMLILLSMKGYNVKTYIQAREELKEKGLYDKTLLANAFTVIQGKHVDIYLSDFCSLSEKVKILAHELGHIVLRHSYQGLIRMYSGANTPQEIEANTFAIFFLAPPCLLLSKGIHTIPEIQKLTLLDERDSETILQRLKVMSSKFSDYELELINICNTPQNKIEKIQPTKLLNKKIALSLTPFVLIVIFTAGRYCSKKQIDLPKPTAPVSVSTTIQKQDPPTIEADTPAVDATSIQIGITDSPKTGATVFATTSGGKYHLESCRYIQGKSALNEYAFEEAQERGLEPCKVCSPDTKKNRQR